MGCQTNINDMVLKYISSTPNLAKTPLYGGKRIFSCFYTSIQLRIMILVSNPMFSGTANSNNSLSKLLDCVFGVKFQF